MQFIEEESEESEPEYECDFWDNDCVISNVTITTKLIQGSKLGVISYSTKC